MGFRVLAEALGRGYRVRAVVRKVAQIEQIKATESVKPHLDLLEFVVVPDLLAHGAFDGFFDGAYGIVHVASPIPSGDVRPLPHADKVLMARANNFSHRPRIPSAT